MSACTSEVTVDQNKAETVAKGFMEALQQQDFATAQKYCTPDARKALVDFETNLKMSNEEEKTVQLSAFDMQIREVTCADEEGTTTCKVCCNTANEPAELELVEQDQKWYINTEIGI